MIWIWSLLAAILAHALVPHADPVARTRGSAFSAATEDVLVLRAITSGELAKRKQAVPTPLDPPAAILGSAGQAIVAARVSIRSQPAATLPPPRPFSLLGPPGQAPPASLT